MRLGPLVAAAVTVTLLASCGDDDSIDLVDQFSDCVEDGGGTVADGVELAVENGQALAVVGGGVDADADLVGRCLEAVSTAR